VAGIENLQDSFARIEKAVADGDTDLRTLGFWKHVSQVKRDQRLAAHWAEVVGRIDRAAFQARIRPRFPVWLGNSVLVVGTLVFAAAVAVALRLAEGIDRPRPGLAGLLVVVAAGGLAVTVHAPAHWLVGRMAGIRFLAYFLNGPFRIQPGVKTDYASYLRATPGRRAAMHAAGALATKAAPFAVFVPAYLRHASAGYELLPEWSLWAVLGIGLVQIFTDVVWSVRHSDWKKVRREVRVGRIQSTPH